MTTSHNDPTRNNQRIHVDMIKKWQGDNASKDDLYELVAELLNDKHADIGMRQDIIDFDNNVDGDDY